MQFKQLRAITVGTANPMVHHHEAYRRGHFGKSLMFKRTHGAINRFFFTNKEKKVTWPMNIYIYIHTLYMYTIRLFILSFVCCSNSCIESSTDHEKRKFS